ncbi:MAG: DALR anticodon-binding domain-containing protein, partial [Patescibacteria group bacterium]
SGEEQRGGAFLENVEMESMERNLMFSCTRLPEIMERVIETWSPHLLATYLFELAQKTNEFYHARPILSEENGEKKQFLLSLVQVVTTTLATGLYLLGIDAPEEM